MAYFEMLSLAEPVPIESQGLRGDEDALPDRLIPPLTLLEEPAVSTLANGGGR
jgi:hypothetical protein